MRPELPNDELGRSWVAAKFDDDHVPEEMALLTLATLWDDELVILGNAFVIADFSDHAICLGAAHSFEEVKKIQDARSIQPHPSIPKVLLSSETRYIKTDGIFAVHIFRDQPTVCTVLQLNYIENYDVAVFVVQSPEGRKIFNGKIAKLRLEAIRK